ncbi:MAG: hypothetical protein V5A27_01090 [Halapricum sp.]
MVQAGNPPLQRGEELERFESPVDATVSCRSYRTFVRAVPSMSDGVGMP